VVEGELEFGGVFLGTKDAIFEGRKLVGRGGGGHC